MRMIRIWVLMTLTGLIALWHGVAVAGGGGGGGGPCAGFASGATLVMRDSCFEGTAHFAEEGSKLVVRNEGKLPHSFTAVDGSFDTDLLEPGETVEIPLKAPGIVRAYCTLHGTTQGHGMAGILVVGKPAPEAVGAIGVAGNLRETFTEHYKALRDEIDTQSKSLTELQAEIAAVRKAVEKTEVGINVDLFLANGLGILGIVLGGAALTVVLRRLRPVGLSGDQRNPWEDGEDHLSSQPQGKVAPGNRTHAM